MSSGQGAVGMAIPSPARLRRQRRRVVQVSATGVSTRLEAAIDFAPSTTAATSAAATSQKPRKRAMKRSMAYR